MPESHQIEPSGTHFVDFWSQGRKVIKSSFLGLVLSTSGAKARKSSTRASWDWFCRLLEPRPGSHQIEPPGTGFVDFWSQGQKVIKSSFLGLVLSTSGAKARKSLNRAWTSTMGQGYWILDLSHSAAVCDGLKGHHQGFISASKHNCNTEIPQTC